MMLSKCYGFVCARTTDCEPYLSTQYTPLHALSRLDPMTWEADADLRRSPKNQNEEETNDITSILLMWRTS
jgi:hypothetical protein